jgi:hypothetical protein
MSQESLNDLIAAGEKLGYAGDDLKTMLVNSRNCSVRREQQQDKLRKRSAISN